MRTVAILPVKSFSEAKHRLSADVSSQVREALAEAMFCDVLEALSRCKALDGVLVVTPGERARRLAEQSGAGALSDAGQGHNQAAWVGVEAAIADGAQRVLLVPGDCPALDPEQVDALVQRPTPPKGIVIVPDRHGSGTNALLLTPPDVLRSSFGPGSCARHAQLARDAGVPAEVVEVSSLALDVDTPADLERLAELGGCAPRTLALLSRC